MAWEIGHTSPQVTSRYETARVRMIGLVAVATVTWSERNMISVPVHAAGRAASSCQDRQTGLLKVRSGALVRRNCDDRPSLAGGADAPEAHLEKPSSEQELLFITGCLLIWQA
jgi:hypothetical protein